MDIKELDKRQLILLTLLITFVVSIATGIITVSLMNQMPKSVPQTINNVIQRTIEKVTTVEVPATNDINNSIDTTNSSTLSLEGGDTLIPIYLKESVPQAQARVDDVVNVEKENATDEVTPLGYGVIISDVGLILVESNILTTDEIYKVILNKTDFNASILKKFNNGFAILKISQITKEEIVKEIIDTKVEE